MSLVTQCPACATLFKVVADQLRISDGWVRCGQCDEVFDANAHLRADVELVLQASEDVVPKADGSAEPITAAEDFFVAQDDAPAADAIPPAVGPMPLDTVPKGDDGSATDMPGLPKHLQFDWPGADDPQEAPKLSFMRDAATQSAWRRPWVRVALAMVCALMGVVLFLQVLLQSRDRIAAVQPELKPFLVQLCSALACRVSPLREIEAVVIESSSLTKIRGDVYRLSVVLKNTSPMAVAMPAVELTLTDRKAHPVLRRVLLPNDFAVTQNIIPASSTVSLWLPIQVEVAASKTPTSGYQLLAFYP